MLDLLYRHIYDLRFGLSRYIKEGEISTGEVIDIAIALFSFLVLLFAVFRTKKLSLKVSLSGIIILMSTYATLVIGKLFHDCTRDWADEMGDQTYANTVPPDRPEELSSYNIIIFFNKESPLVYWRRGGMHELNENLREAVNDYSKSIELDSEYNGANALLDRGYCKEKLNDLDGALEDYNNAIIINPWKERYYHFRARLKNKTGDKEGALNDLNAAIKYWDDFVHARLLRAQLLTEAGEFSKAMEDYDKSHLDDRYYDDAEYSSDFRNRGLCRYATGDNKGACFDLNVASKFDSLARLKFMEFCK